MVLPSLAPGLTESVLTVQEVLDTLLELGGPPAAAQAVCKAWAARARHAVNRWNTLTSEWTRTGVRVESEWVGNYTDDGDEGDFDMPFSLSALHEGGFCVADDNFGTTRLQVFDEEPVHAESEGVRALPVEASSAWSRACVGRGAAFVLDCKGGRAGESKLTKVDLATGAAVGVVSAEFEHVSSAVASGVTPDLAVHEGTLFLHVGSKIVLVSAETLAILGAMGEGELAGEATWGGIAVYAEAEELYVCQPHRDTILVFAVGSRRDAGRSVGKLRAVAQPVQVAAGGGSLFVVDEGRRRLHRLTRHGVRLQTLGMFECSIWGVAVGAGDSVGKVWLLCSGPGEWNVYGGEDSTVHVLRLRSAAECARLPSDGGASAALPAGRWESDDLLAGEDEGPVLSAWQQRLLEAAYHRGDAEVSYPYRGHAHTVTLRPALSVVSEDGERSELRRVVSDGAAEQPALVAGVPAGP